MKQKYLNGSSENRIEEYEILHGKIARKSAREGMVLLENKNGLLPLTSGKRVALYGSGAVRTMKGGTGSGDVNERKVIHIWQGLKDAGFVITNEEYLKNYEIQYEEGKKKWKDSIWFQADQESNDDLLKFFDIYCKTKFVIPAGDIIKTAEANTDTAIYILSRVAGEGADRFAQNGDYYLSEEEEVLVDSVCNHYSNVILLINTGGIVDLTVFEQWNSIQSILYISQPGMEAGHAVADILLGTISPSGKLTDSWAISYSDYPNFKTFSHNNGNINEEIYEEGIYVGYRYFDSFEIPLKYGFGYGLSYTNFSISTLGIEKIFDENGIMQISVKVNVQNTGNQYSGKEVVQVYVTPPQGEKLEKEYRRLVGFAKTTDLAPGESQKMHICFTPYQMSSYDESEPGWILESGEYILWTGNSLQTASVCGAVTLSEEVVLVKTQNICECKQSLQEISLESSLREARNRKALLQLKNQELPLLQLKESELQIEKITYSLNQSGREEALQLAKSLSIEELIQLATGDPAKGQGGNLGSAGLSVSGSAGETSSCGEEKQIPSIVLADGPAGLRLNKSYYVKEGKILQMPFLNSIEGGYLLREEKDVDGDEYHQYCTAFPVGTLLAQTWDTDLVQEVGNAVGQELQMFQITLWLAPGMNIHRNPLCGRNFEYYSEDPLISGMMAASLTIGVQKEAGCGTTIKHFACNNQEDNRMGSNSIVSERVLREIYFKGFEIAVKKSQPMSIMTSYNLINGIHSANNFDLCTKAARMEWGFRGVIMTDWLTTNQDDSCTASGCMRAGNDLIMPGMSQDHENIKKELETGTLSEESLRRCISNLLYVILKSNQYEDAVPYTVENTY